MAGHRDGSRTFISPDESRASRAADCPTAAVYTITSFSPTSVLLVLSAFICVHLRPISGFDFSRWASKKHIRPQMNADERR
jgi:hypothetical protein